MNEGHGTVGRTLAATLLLTAALSGLPPARVAAQPQRLEVHRADANVEVTRMHLRGILRQYPPSLAQVLRLDPSLLTNEAYLAPYPDLASFLAQHAEVAHNPAYFIGDSPLMIDANAQRAHVSSDVVFFTGTFLFFIAAIGVIGYIGRSVLEHRRWLHATKVQTDTHNKLVDRLTSNEELLGYIQSPAGQRFLAGSGMLAESSAQVSAPLGRILGSVQIGLVLAFGGFGLLIANHRVTDVVQPLFQVIATVAIAIGIGFIVSGLVSYGFSRQLGLIHSAPAPRA